MVTLDQAGAGAASLTLRACLGAAVGAGELSWIQARIPLPDQPGWRIVPDTHPHLIHHRGVDGTRRTTLVGARSRHVDVTQGERAFTVGIRLRPGSLPSLIGGSAWELRDASVDVASLADGRARALLERVDSETEPPRVEAALLALLAHIGRSVAIDWRASAFMSALSGSAAHRCPVRCATDRLGVSERSLRDACRTTLGLRPKEAHRIVRLHRALGDGLGGRADASVAARAGYADQSHMIRDHKALLGETPEAFRARARADSSKPARAVVTKSRG